MVEAPLRPASLRVWQCMRSQSHAGLSSAFTNRSYSLLKHDSLGDSAATCSSLVESSTGKQTRSRRSLSRRPLPAFSAAPAGECSLQFSFGKGRHVTREDASNA